MWYSEINIQEKKEGMRTEIPIDFFSTPCSKKEFEFISKHVSNGRDYNDFPVPSFLKLPNEYLQLLKHSEGGIIVNEEREFGFFDIETIREFYISYEFIFYAPEMLPIAFNGSGTFYVYNFKEDIENPPIYGIHSSCIGDEDEPKFLGNTLYEVLNKTKDIDDEIDEYQSQVKPNDIQKQKRIQLNELKASLTLQLREIKDKKSKGEIDLKTYIKSKRNIEQKINELK